MRIDEEQTPKRNEPSSHEKGGANSDHTYWLAVNIVWVVFTIQMLLYMYLVYGPDFWMEFFK